MLASLAGFVPGEDDCGMSGFSCSVLLGRTDQGRFPQQGLITTWEVLKYNIFYRLFCAVVLSFIFSFPHVKIVLEKAFMNYRVVVLWEPFCYVKALLINMLLHFHLKIFWWETHFKFFYQAKLNWKPSLLWKQLSDFPELVLDTQKLKKCFSSAPECIQDK